MINTDLKIDIQGHLTVIRRDAASKNILDIWDKKNVITYGAAESITKLIAPNAVFGATVQQESAIKSMRFGTSNVAPQRTDTGLNVEAIVGLPIRIELFDANRVFGSAGTVLFVATMDTLTGNGLTYREAGLFTRGDSDDPLPPNAGSTLFAHQTFPDQIKTGAIELEFRWRITFTV